MSCAHSIQGMWEMIEPGHYALTAFGCVKCNQTWAPGEAPVTHVCGSITRQDYDALFLSQYRMTMDEAALEEDGGMANRTTNEFSRRPRF